MTERRMRQRGQATVEHVGILVLVLTLVLAVTAVAVRPPNPSAGPPDLVGRLADRLAAPLGGTPPAPEAAARADAVEPPWAFGGPREPSWKMIDPHPHEAPIGRWLRKAKGALADHLPDMGWGCIRNQLPFEQGLLPAARVRAEMGVPALAKKLLKRANGPLGRCVIGAAGALLS
jgi:hypothetical protein